MELAAQEHAVYGGSECLNWGNLYTLSISKLLYFDADVWYTI